MQESITRCHVCSTVHTDCVENGIIANPGLHAGEYIAVEKVEAVFKKNSNVEQIWVYGNSYESVLVAVVVPNEVRPPVNSFRASLDAA